MAAEERRCAQQTMSSSPHVTCSGIYVLVEEETDGGEWLGSSAGASDGFNKRLTLCGRVHTFSARVINTATLQCVHGVGLMSHGPQRFITKRKALLWRQTNV
jgi:hypothetical protein